MRLKIFLSPDENPCRITFNYQYFLASSIYNLLRHSDELYAEQLHNNGLRSRDGKPLKLFTFSNLIIPQKEIERNEIVIRNHHPCFFYISSPMVDDFVKNIVISLFDKQQIQIKQERLTVLKVDAVPTPDFEEECKFKCLSPFVLSTMHRHKGRLTPYYLRPDDAELGSAVKNNLVRKFQTFYNREPANTDLEFELDKLFISSRNPRRLTKLITLKEGQGSKETKIKGIFVPFKLTGSLELIKIAWDAGIGMHCSQGFGCIELIN